MFRMLRRFSKVINVQEKTPESVLGAEAAESLKEYSRAMDFIVQKEWAEAEKELEKCSKIIENSGQALEPSHNFVLQRIAITQRAQGKYSKCEETLEKVVHNYQVNSQIYRDQLEFSYQTLYKQYLASNILKAVKLGEILQSPSLWTGLKKETQKNVKFFYATALALQGKDFNKAKASFIECLKMNPEGNSCFVYHNLGTTQWMHLRKFEGNEFETLTGSEQEEFKKATLDFSETVPNLQKAIQLFEGFPDVYTLESGLGFKNKLTGLSLTNIAEVYLELLEPDVKVSRKD